MSFSSDTSDEDICRTFYFLYYVIFYSSLRDESFWSILFISSESPDSDLPYEENTQNTKKTSYDNFGR